MEQTAMAKILIVDDTPLNVRLLLNALKAKKYEVTTRSSGEQALEKIAVDKPDLILLDVIMPGINGIEVCERLKQNPETKDIPIIIISVLDEHKDIIHGLNVGAIDYITKPFYIPIVLARVNSVLRMKESYDTEACLRSELEDKMEELKRAHHELKRSQQKILHLQKTKSIGKFSGGMAHEFNNLLFIIQSSIDLLRLSINEEENIKLVNNIEHSIKRGNEFIEQMQTYARQHDYQQVQFNVNDALAGFKQTLDPHSEKDISIDFTLEDKQLITKGDPFHFTDLLYNLVSNALDAIDKTGSISVKTALVIPVCEEKSKLLKQEYICISVTDDGVGISSDEIDKVFDPFYTTKEVGEGAGLGLSKVWGYVDAFGGEVTIDSKPGVGTTINVYLPLAQE